jgi:hypothetical protein
MATKTILVDDLDGTDAFRTVRFSFDGRTFDIDLSREHFDALKHGLTPWMNAAREVSRYAPRPDAKPRMTKAESRAIREWGVAQGMSVPATGKIREAVVVAYHAAHRPGSQAA